MTTKHEKEKNEIIEAMSILYNKYFFYKKEFLTQRNIYTLLCQKSVIDVKYWEDRPLDMCKMKLMPGVLLFDTFDIIDDILTNYDLLYNKLKKYGLFGLSYVLPVKSELSTEHIESVNIIDYLKQKISIDYTINWNFKNDHSITNICSKSCPKSKDKKYTKIKHINRFCLPTMKIDVDIFYHIFGIINYHKYLYAFGIIYGNNNSEIDYFSYQLNIHLLRIINPENIKQQIYHFIKNILNKENTNHIIINPSDDILITKKNAQLFQENYLQLHKIQKSYPSINTDNKQNRTETITEDDFPCFQISDTIYQNIISQKQFYVAPRDTVINKIIGDIELIDKNNNVVKTKDEHNNDQDFDHVELVKKLNKTIY